MELDEDELVLGSIRKRNMEIREDGHSASSDLGYRRCHIGPRSRAIPNIGFGRCYK